MTLELNDEQTVTEDEEIIEALEPEQAETVSDEVIIIKRTTMNYIVIAVAFLILGMVIGVAVIAPTQNNLTAEMVSTAVAQAINNSGLVRAAPSAPSGPAPIVDVSVDDDPAWGPEDAPVVMVEFSDFQCPFCGRFHQETYSRLRETYEGRIRFVYRDLPLPEIHPDAIRAAQAAECADEQGIFWEYHDLIFTNQLNLSRDALGDFADQLGLDMDAFNDCLDSGRYEQEVASDMQAAAGYGIRGTPTFFINGRAVVGAQPFEVFAAVIDDELAKAGQNDSAASSS